MLPIEHRIYELIGMSPLLGSQPANPAVHTQYVSSKAPSPAQTDAEDALLPDVAEKGVTVFLRHPDNDALCIMPYVLLGFLKESLNALKDELGLKMVKSRVAQYLFAFDAGENQNKPIAIYRDVGAIGLTADGKFPVALCAGHPVMEEDSICERPLRAETMQGPRVTLAASEQIDAPWRLLIRLSLLKNNGTKQSRPLSWEAIETALDYGALKGLCQWRNGGYGRFDWRLVCGGAEA